MKLCSKCMKGILAGAIIGGGLYFLVREKPESKKGNIRKGFNTLVSSARDGGWDTSGFTDPNTLDLIGEEGDFQNRVNSMASSPEAQKTISELGEGSDDYIVGPLAYVVYQLEGRPEYLDQWSTAFSEHGAQAAADLLTNKAWAIRHGN